ncbi:protein phosphatase 2C domain-containing protein [Roseiflexus sp.]|uniref:protein phosphatase 2C domain-containing protein n=1 Tax=Roseiflexus sp. TaxID=2562120 RepID=UPI00398A8A01
MATSTASFDIDARTDRGRRRTNNEDSIGRADQWSDRDQQVSRALREQYGRLYVVADGVGGNADGEDASRMVVNEVMRAFYHNSSGVLPENPVERLRAAIEQANSAVYAEAQRRGNNMASTIVAALIHGDTLTVANVGDSMAFLCRSGQSPKPLTKAQVRQEADGGKALVQAMGDQRVHPAMFSVQLHEGDAIVLCSDGLTDLVQPAEIAEIVTVHSSERSTRALIDLANRRGGHDNISVIVIRNGPPPKLAPAASPGLEGRARMLAASLFVAALLAVVVIAAPYLNPPPPGGENNASRPTSAPVALVGGGNQNTAVLAGLPTATLGALPTATATETALPTGKPRPTAPVNTPAARSTPKPGTMPDLIGKSRQEAEEIIKNITGALPVIEEISDNNKDIPADHVVETVPGPGMPINPGEPIRIKVRKQELSPTPTESPTAPPAPPPAPPESPKPPESPPAPPESPPAPPPAPPESPKSSPTATPKPSTAPPPAPSEPTTVTPEPTTVTPEPTTVTPEPTTVTPEPTTVTPEPTTVTPGGSGS